MERVRSSDGTAIAYQRSGRGLLSSWCMGRRQTTPGGRPFLQHWSDVLRCMPWTVGDGVRAGTQSPTRLSASLSTWPPS